MVNNIVQLEIRSSSGEQCCAIANKVKTANSGLMHHVAIKDEEMN